MAKIPPGTIKQLGCARKTQLLFARGTTLHKTTRLKDGRTQWVYRAPESEGGAWYRVISVPGANPPAYDLCEFVAADCPCLE